VRTPTDGRNGPDSDFGGGGVGIAFVLVMQLAAHEESIFCLQGDYLLATPNMPSTTWLPVQIDAPVQ